MKAVRLVATRHPLELQELDVPEPGPQDVLIRVKAAGICHSDAHYRAGRSLVSPLPLTLGHEVAGVVEETGQDVSRFRPGDRVCLHYLVSCGVCDFCQSGNEQFCVSGKMIGKFRDGGYAEFIVVPSRSVFPLPEPVPFDQGAILMCSSATSLHALNKARLRPGETVAVFGVGGLGISAIQLAKVFGAGDIFGVDIKAKKLAQAEQFGAMPINALTSDPVQEILKATRGRGVDVALELIGSPQTMRQAVQCLAIKGRAALVGITEKTVELLPYAEVLNKEAEIIGVSDHLAQELPQLLEWARRCSLDLSQAITRSVPLQADAINAILDELERFEVDGRVVIRP